MEGEERRKANDACLPPPLLPLSLSALSRRMRDTGADTDDAAHSDTENTSECAHNSTARRGSQTAHRSYYPLLGSFSTEVGVKTIHSLFNDKVSTGNLVRQSMRALSSSISAFRDLAHSLSESGRTISSDGESGEERSGAGQNVALF